MAGETSVRSPLPSAIVSVPRGVTRVPRPQRERPRREPQVAGYIVQPRPAGADTSTALSRTGSRDGLQEAGVPERVGEVGDVSDGVDAARSRV
jgi:hypothetical protein